MESLAENGDDFEAGLASHYRPNVFEDLEHYDEPSPEDAEDLDERVWDHIDRLIAAFDEDDQADRYELTDDDDARCRVCGCTEDDCRGCVERTGSPCHWVEPDLCSACRAPQLARPEESPGPLARSLAQLAFGWQDAQIPTTKGRRTDRSKPGDVPGWKGGVS